MAGLAVQAGDINVTSGTICRDVTHALNRASNFKRFLDRYSSATLVSMFGMTSLADADLLKSAFTDLATINVTFQANRAFLDQLAGMGDV